MEVFKFHPKTNQPITDWETTPITTQMEAIAKLIARTCMKTKELTGGIGYKFTVSDIYDVKTNEPLGTVTIQWELK